MTSIVRPVARIARHRKAIAVDLDEVLCPFLLPMAKWKGLKYPREPKSLEMVYEFYETEEFRRIEPLPGAWTGMAKLYDNGYKIYVVSGRQSRIRDETERWLGWNFPFQIHDLILTNSYMPCEIQKSDICKAIGANMIIDDNYDICVQCEQEHIKAYNFVGDPMYPWCKDSDMALSGWDKLAVENYMDYY